MPRVERVGFHGIDLETLEHAPADTLGLNDIGRVTLVTAARRCSSIAYRTNRSTGAFILIDSLTNDTVAAGMIVERARAIATTARGP